MRENIKKSTPRPPEELLINNPHISAKLKNLILHDIYVGCWQKTTCTNKPPLKAAVRLLKNHDHDAANPFFPSTMDVDEHRIIALPLTYLRAYDYDSGAKLVLIAHWFGAAEAMHHSNAVGDVMKSLVQCSDEVRPSFWQRAR